MDTKKTESVNDTVKHEKRQVGRPKGTKNDPNKQYGPDERQPGRPRKTESQRQRDELLKKANKKPVGRPRKSESQKERDELLKKANKKPIGRPRKHPKPDIEPTPKTQ